jgi:hypothetical protein
MKVLYVGLSLAVLALGACENRDYVRPNTTQDQFDKDVANCRRQVDTVMARDRNIDSDINSTVGAQSGNMNQGNTQLRQQMDARGTSSRSSKLMENCLSARGYTPASKSPGQPAVQQPAPAKQSRRAPPARRGLRRALNSTVRCFPC